MYDGQQNRDTDRPEHLAWGDKQNIPETNVKCYPYGPVSNQILDEGDLAAKTNKLNVPGLINKAQWEEFGGEWEPAYVCLSPLRCSSETNKPC